MAPTDLIASYNGKVYYTDWDNAQFRVSGGTLAAINETPADTLNLNAAAIWDDSPFSSNLLSNRVAVASIKNTMNFVRNSSYLGSLTASVGGYAGGGSGIAGLAAKSRAEIYSLGGGFRRGYLGGGGSRIGDGSRNNPAEKFNAKLKLIEDFCDEHNITIDLDTIKERYANNPTAGIKFCDNVINKKFDQAKLKKFIKEKYKEYNEDLLDKGRTIANEWVSAVNKSGLSSPNISAAGVNKQNVLEVIGAFAQNNDVKSGKVKLRQVFDTPEAAIAIINVLVEKGNDYLQDKNVSVEAKTNIRKTMKALSKEVKQFERAVAKDKANANFDRTNIENYFIELFGYIRNEEGRLRDKEAPEFFALPEDTKIDFKDDGQQKNAAAEYKNLKEGKNKVTITA